MYVFLNQNSYSVQTESEEKSNDLLFESIASDISSQGYSIFSNAIPSDLSQSLMRQARDNSKGFNQAGVGRQSQHTVNKAIRSDKISWIDGDTQAGHAWIHWTYELQQFLNRRLFLGLNYFESHFAHYEQGSFYKKHKDAFVGQGNRILSIVTYLNEDWSLDDGGQLVIYDEAGKKLAQVLPERGTIALFLSEEFPHEVLPAYRERYSIAGWYRANNS